MLRLATLAALVLLTACATPREACLRAATSDLRTVERLISETEANLSRGFAIEREPYTRTGLDFCFGTGGYRGYGGFGLNYCRTVETRYRDRPVAIDPAAERRKLADLKRTRARLAPVTQERIAACPA